MTGTRAIYSLADELFAFDVDGKATTSIAEGVMAVSGMSEDAAQIYFVSKEALDGDAVAGQPNLYLHDDAGDHYVATLAPEDSVQDSPPSPLRRRCPTS